MDIILVPGFWLDASSWDEVVPALEEAGHTVHALTLPGLESKDAARADIGLRTHIDAVIRTLDSLDGKAILVGHSGGGAIIHGVVDARPDRVARAIYVDSGPLGEGGVINDELPAEGDEIPLPPWEAFEDADLVDLDEDLRTAFRARAIPQPKGVAVEQQHLHNVRRYEVPATVIACEFPSSMLNEMMDAGHPFTEELARIKQADFIDLPTGHWPQFTKPAELGTAILAAVGRAA
ncbi:MULTISPECIES: alpha/beta fold hydrolase [Paenarthrobacter]|jgi:pimeloyl-ACP methyl ester carboxylesterase|uniref:alpha/beta fold hydrolase n=1 Tax=Paenarthrobacter TaxID=1742992 RepID=UPI001877BEEF|nr:MULTISPECIES: alpha/beta hydrolase [Paenarthrobacter]QOT15423.1 alpha/beta fold hydrolase [Paenarthrobacter sp. YJN-5]QQQ62104.1 alpha/beta fold hydrolase [Paenarthrobacter ureafaciens]UOD81076.1 alpha/beta fold hydrolase [Paenarthrobacter ureafaciens]WNZ03735.1 alpha/beta fold hydrolase [Paenarthrobacter ureafaciens]